MRKSRWDYDATKMWTKANDEQTDDDGVIEKKIETELWEHFQAKLFSYRSEYR